MVLTRSHGNITGGSPTLSRRDSTSPRPLRRPLHPGGGSMEQVAHTDVSSPPGSPTTYRRFNSREENVFSRLTASRQPTSTDPQPIKGIISQYQGKTQPRAKLP